MQVTVAIPRSFPLRLGRVRRAISTRLDFWFLTIWWLQCHIASWILIALVVIFGIPEAVLIMTIWALLATYLYETARRRGLDDMLETPTVRAARKPGLWGWLRYVLKAYVLDPKQVLFAWALESRVQENRSDRFSKVVKGAAILVALMLLGVIATHHTLRQAGFSSRRVYIGNMIGRLLNYPVKMVETTITVTPWLIVISFGLSLLHRLV